MKLKRLLIAPGRTITQIGVDGSEPRRPHTRYKKSNVHP
jgi:hypothetical protein